MNLLKKIDLFGKKPTLFVNSEIRYKTSFGGVLTVLTVVMSLVLTVYFSVRVFARSNIFTVESREYLETQTLDLSEYNYLFQLTEYNGNLYSLSEERKMVSLSIVYFFTDKEGDPTQKETEFALEPCTETHLGAKAGLYASLLTLERYYCLPLDYKLRLYGVYGGIKPFSATLINIQYCIAGKFGKKDCFSKTEIRRRLENFYVNMAFLDFNIQNNNIDTPGVPYLRTERVQVGVNFFKRLFFEMDVVEYTSDFGLVFTSTRSSSFFTVSNYTLIPDANVENMLLGVTFSIGRSKIHMLRYFEKMQQVVSNIGGAIKALTASSVILVRFAYDNSYFNDLSTALNFKVERESTIINSSKASRIEFVKLKRSTENHKITWAVNLKLLLKSREIAYLEDKFQKVKEILSSENLVKVIVEFENLKQILFSRESAVLFESLGRTKVQKPSLEKAFAMLKNKERTEMEDKLLDMIN